MLVGAEIEPRILCYGFGRKGTVRQRWQGFRMRKERAAFSNVGKGIVALYVADIVMHRAEYRIAVYRTFRDEFCQRVITGQIAPGVNEQHTFGGNPGP